MPSLRPDLDPDGLLEFSVVFTDRSLNHMSRAFQGVMRDIHAVLCEVHGASRAVIVPGGGSYAMEAVARQFATGRKVLVVRNGFFSYRWSQIFQMGAIPSAEIVLKARRTGDGPLAPFAPAPVEEVVAAIRAERPEVVFAPHVETASGMILPEGYIRAVADAVHEAGGLFVLDGVASGCVWVDMAALGVDVLISAPQKGWSASPCAGLVMLNDAALERCRAATSTSFAADLGRWLAIMEAYLGGGHAYHATMPTDALRGCATRCWRRRRSASSGWPPRSGRRAARCGLCWPSAGSPRWRPRASRRPAWWWPTRTTRRCRTASASPPRACRSPPACR
jgi:aspartate aminotransferase-like enzyme